MEMMLVRQSKEPRDKWQYKALVAQSDWINEIFHSYYNQPRTAGYKTPATVWRQN